MADLREIYDNMMAAIDEIDVQLDSLSGGKTAGKRKIVNELMEKHNNVWASPTEEIVNFIKSQDPEVQVAVVNALSSELRKNFEKETTAYVEGIVDSLPKQEALISQEESQVISKQRSDLYQKVKSIVELATATGEGEWEMPRMRRGSVGERGPRNLSLFVFSVDGEEVDMTIGQIAKANGYDKASELTKALRTPNEETGWEGFDTKDGSEFSGFRLPNGKVLSGVRDEDESEEEDES